MNIFIHHRDLRINDNITLNLMENTVPIFIFTPEQITTNKYKSDKFVKFMCENLKDLENQYIKKKSFLNFFYGDSLEILKEINKKYKINSIGFNVDYSPYAKKRDDKIIKWCEKNKIKIITKEDMLLVAITTGNTLAKSSGHGYKVFTPFKNYLKKTYKIDNISNKSPSLIKKIINIKSRITNIDDFYEESDELIFKPGRANALKQLQKLKNQKKYTEMRNCLTYETSRLSAYINLGLISIREVYYYALKILGTKTTFIDELYWRDFYYNVLYFYPHVVGSSFNLKYKNIKWTNNKEFIKKWKEGKTGFPVVDACMRELNNTGYMHNRGRMIVSSFLIKDLLVDWKIGEKYFATKLLDYNISANNGGWQWSAGTGTDAQPYFRIFEPWTQSKKFDPNCIYIKKWLPELKNVKCDDIHKWYDKYEDYDNIKYYIPIIEHSIQREKALKLYKII